MVTTVFTPDLAKYSPEIEITCGDEYEVRTTMGEADTATEDPDPMITPGTFASATSLPTASAIAVPASPVTTLTLSLTIISWASRFD
jgi:hypothetical protein